MPNHQSDQDRAIDKWDGKEWPQTPQHMIDKIIRDLELGGLTRDTAAAQLKQLLADEIRAARIKTLTDVDNLGLLDFNSNWHQYYMTEIQSPTTEGADNE